MPGSNRARLPRRLAPTSYKSAKEITYRTRQTYEVLIRKISDTRIAPLQKRSDAFLSWLPPSSLKGFGFESSLGILLAPFSLETHRSIPFRISHRRSNTILAGFGLTIIHKETVRSGNVKIRRYALERLRAARAQRLFLEPQNSARLPDLSPNQTLRAKEHFSMTGKKIADGIVHKAPADLGKVIGANRKALSAWSDITPIARNEWICWIESAKKPETRNRRIERAREDLINGHRRPCCWPGCPHR